jgi:hypothetical protein
MRKNALIGSIVAAILVGVLLAASPVMAAPNIKEKGTLEEVQDNGKTAVITTQGDNVVKAERLHRGAYQVLPYAIIINGFGKKAALETFKLPAKIQFEVEYTSTGAVIKKIRELPQ